VLKGKTAWTEERVERELRGQKSVLKEKTAWTEERVVVENFLYKTDFLRSKQLTTKIQ
jgi:hypothetical protein